MEFLENAHFDQQKSINLNRTDLSKKGSVDEPISALVNAINGSEDFFTTSSCSGRVILFSYDDAKAKKSNCRWHFTSHQPVDDYLQFKSSLDRANLEYPRSPMTLKFEPFILHVQCRTLVKAKSMHTCALECGFRNSGLTLGKGGKCTLAVRGTLCLEVPLGCCPESISISDDYLRYLINDVIGEKFASNALGITNFENALKSVL